MPSLRYKRDIRPERAMIARVNKDCPRGDIYLSRSYLSYAARLDIRHFLEAAHGLQRLTQNVRGAFMAQHHSRALLVDIEKLLSERVEGVQRTSVERRIR